MKERKCKHNGCQERLAENNTIGYCPMHNLMRIKAKEKEMMHRGCEDKRVWTESNRPELWGETG